MCKNFLKGKRKENGKMHHCISKVHMQVSKYSKRRKPSVHEKANKTQAIPKKEHENHTNRSFNFLKIFMVNIYVEEFEHDCG